MFIPEVQIEMLCTQYHGWTSALMGPKLECLAFSSETPDILLAKHCCSRSRTPVETVREVPEDPARWEPGHLLCSLLSWDTCPSNHNAAAMFLRDSSAHSSDNIRKQAVLVHYLGINSTGPHRFRAVPSTALVLCYG